MSRFVRPDAVRLLAEAYRNRHTPLGRAILENRHRDFLPAECIAAAAEVLVELKALVIVREERQRFDADDLQARVEVLRLLDWDERAWLLVNLARARMLTEHVNLLRELYGDDDDE